MTIADLVPAWENEGAWSARLQVPGEPGGVQPDGTVTAPPDPGTLFDTFSAWATDRGFTLYPHQEESLLEIVSDSNVIVGTPTGSGKSLIATAALFAGLATGRRAYYTAPIKALVSEKFFDLVEIFGPAAVGMITGDSAVNADAPIICCTAEILAGIALREGIDADAGIVVMDEFHYYGDPQRGWAWQVPLLELNRAQFVLMSATLGDVRFFADDLTTRTGRPTAVMTGVQRPVPAALLVHPGAADGNPAGPAGDQPRAGLHRALHPGRRPGARPGAGQPDRRHPRRAGRDRRHHRRFPVLRRASAGHCPGWCGTGSACITPACCPSTGDWSRSSPSQGCSR